MKKIERFDSYMKFKGLNDNKVTSQLGLSVGLISKSRKVGRDLSDNVIEKILNYYTDLNKIWLLTGEGEMLVAKQLNNEEESANTVVIPASAWKIIQAQAESLAIRDRQIDVRDRQIDELIQLLKTQINDNEKNDVCSDESSRADV